MIQQFGNIGKSWFSGRGWGQQLFNFRVRRFTESPGPLHWIAFPLEILTKPSIHWIASPLFTEKPFFPLKSASSHPLPKNPLWIGRKRSRSSKDGSGLPKVSENPAEPLHGTNVTSTKADGESHGSAVNAGSMRTHLAVVFEGAMASEDC